MSGQAVDDGAAGTAGSSCPPGVSGGQDRGWAVTFVCVVMPAALVASTSAALIWAAVAVTATPRMPFSHAVLSMIIAAVGAGSVRHGWVLAGKRTPLGPAGSSGWGQPTPGKVLRSISIGLWLMAFSAAVMIQEAVTSSVGAGGGVGIVGGPALLAAFAGYLLRRYGGLGVVDDGSPRPSLGLRAGERAVWTGRAHSRWPFSTWLLVALLGPGMLDRDRIDQLLGTVVLVVVCLLGFTSVRVTVAARGVTVGYGVLRLRLTRIPLRKIASAEAVEQEKFGFPFPFAGSLLVFGRASVVLRRGPALRLTLRDGRTFLVTVDDAATGAGLLNDLIAGAS
jgi:hypothetical protein